MLLLLPKEAPCLGGMGCPDSKCLNQSEKIWSQSGKKLMPYSESINLDFRVTDAI